MAHGYLNSRMTGRALRSAVMNMLDNEPPESWRDHAACIASDPTLFDEGDDGEENKNTFILRRARRIVALAVCADCPVAEECLDEAVVDRAVSIIRGGRIFPQTWDGIPTVRQVGPSPEQQERQRLMHEKQNERRRATRAKEKAAKKK